MSVRMQCAELSRSELDLVLLGQISALLSNSKETNAHRPATSCLRSSMAFYHAGVRICRVTFQKLHGIGIIIHNTCKRYNKGKHTTGKDRFMNFKASFLASELTTRQHGNSRRLLKHALKLDEVKNLVTPVTNYTEKNAILLPGHIPGYKQDDLQLLPSSTTKKVKSFLDLCCTLHSYMHAHTNHHIQHSMVHYITGWCIAHIQT